MKKFNLFLISLVILTFSAQAQILNPSFESWDSGRPTDWAGINGFVTNITQTSDAHHGSYAVQLEIVNFSNTPWPASFYTINDNSSTIPGHPVSERYSKLKGYVKADLKGSAAFWGGIIIYDESQQGIGAGTFFLTNSSANWILIDVPIEYYSNNTPSYLSITFNLIDSLGGDVTAIGSTVKIDHLTLDTPTSVALNDNTPLTFALDQNYPNPFNPSTTIRYSIPNESEVSLSVYDELGQKVDELYSGVQSAGSFEVSWNASNFASGVYFLRMNAVSLQNSKRFSDVKKLILLK